MKSNQIRSDSGEHCSLSDGSRHGDPREQEPDSGHRDCGPGRDMRHGSGRRAGQEQPLAQARVLEQEQEQVQDAEHPGEEDPGLAGTRAGEPWAPEEVEEPELDHNQDELALERVQVRRQGPDGQVPCRPVAPCEPPH